jgi:ribose 1,5-bisphosphokinase
MSFIATALRLLTSRASLVGPGRLVLVVGPSGAGKDSLITAARAACRDDATVVFPRRVVTRPPSAFEDNECLPPAAFEQAAAAGRFAFCWGAHGHRYAIPLSIHDDLGAGRTVVCNVSRTVVESVRRRYAHVTAVLVTAPPEVIAARLAARERPSDGALADRLGRSELVRDQLRPDVVIDNVHAPEVGARKLVDTIYAIGVFLA